VTSLGDLDGDGVTDLAVGAYRDDTGGMNRGAVHVLFLRGPQPATISLPAGGGNYEVLTSGAELVVRITGGAEQFRQSAASISSLTISGSPNADIVTVLNDGGVVATPISFIGGGSNDRLDATLAMGPVTLDGGGGDDTLLGGSQNDILNGGDGVDLAEISGASITVTNSSASRTDVDTLTSIEKLMLIAAGPGSVIDASEFTLGPATIVGSGGSDTLLSGSGNDFIVAGGGHDSVSSGAGNDFIMGNSGRDTLSGGSGNDTILGGSGRDSIEGGLDADLLLGGSGSDTIGGGDGDDRIRGGGGRDVLDGDDGPDTLIGGGGRDNLAGGLGDDNLNGVDRDDNFSDQIGRDLLIGGPRPAARPAPVSADDDPASADETPHFLSPPAFSESSEEIDEAFGGPLLPELLEL
jgi:Ca2+-binding RTX toxin-like protein